MTNPEHHVVERAGGCAVLLGVGQRVGVTTPEGSQVADLWAFVEGDTTEHLSARHTRLHVGRLFPAVGEDFVTNQRRPILRLTADDSPGVHDMLIAACDPRRYEMLGVPGHPNCADNLRAALAGFGRVVAEPPQPVNVFMAVKMDASGRLFLDPSPARPGNRVELEALQPTVVVVSACPQDIGPVNGGAPSGLLLDVSDTADVPAESNNMRPANRR